MNEPNPVRAIFDKVAEACADMSPTDWEDPAYVVTFTKRVEEAATEFGRSLTLQEREILITLVSAKFDLAASALYAAQAVKDELVTAIIALWHAKVCPSL